MRRQQPGRSVLKQTTSESLELCRDWPVDVGVGDMGVGDILCGCPRVSAGVRGRADRRGGEALSLSWRWADGGASANDREPPHTSGSGADVVTTLSQASVNSESRHRTS